MANQSYVYGSGVTNIKGVNSFEIGDTYSQYDIVFFSGYTESQNTYTAVQLGSSTGHYYYTGTENITADTTNSPDQSSSDWTQKLFSRSSYGCAVRFENLVYQAGFGDGYYSILSKSENSLRTVFDLKFDKRSNKETRALVHLFEDSFNKGDKVSGGYTGIYFTPFAPYNEEHEFYIQEFNRSYDYPNVNTVSVSLYREDQSTTDWQGYYIPFNQTRGFFTVGETYSTHDIVYLSGDAEAFNDKYTIYQSGWYYYTGLEESVASDSNSPAAENNLWTKDTFYFSLNQGLSINQKPRFLEMKAQNDYLIRVKDGINNKLLSLDFSLDGRTDKETKAIIHFLEHKGGAQQFRFTPPAPYNKENLVFICPTWEHGLVYKDNNNISVKFVEFPINSIDLNVTFKSLVTIDPYFRSNEQRQGL